jgi:hypothetical protein
LLQAPLDYKRNIHYASLLPCLNRTKLTLHA